MVAAEHFLIESTKPFTVLNDSYISYFVIVLKATDHSLKKTLNTLIFTSTTHDYVAERVVQIKKPAHITHIEFSFHAFEPI